MYTNAYFTPLYIITLFEQNVKSTNYGVQRSEITGFLKTLLMQLSIYTRVPPGVNSDGFQFQQICFLIPVMKIVSNLDLLCRIRGWKRVTKWKHCA
jgi:hypothetical protein